MRILLISVILFSILEVGFAQNERFDSINQVNLDRIRRMDTDVLPDLHALRSLAKADGSKRDYAGTIKNIAAYFIVFGNRDSAFHYLDKGLDIIASDSMAPVRASFLINKGILLYRMGRNDVSYRLYLDALRIAEHNKDSGQAANTLLNMAITDSELERFPEALGRYEMALKWRTNEAWFRANVLSNMGILHAQMGDTAEAVHLYQESITIAAQAGRADLLANSKFNLANILANTENTDEARRLYEEAAVIFEELGMQRGMHTLFSAFGSMEFKEGNYTKALELYEYAFSLSEGNPKLYSEIQTNLALTHAALGHYQEAYEFLNASVSLTDSLKGAEVQQRVKDLEREYELDKIRLEREKDRLEAEQRELQLSRRNGWLLAGLAMTLLLLAILLFRRNQLRQVQEKKAILAQQEKEQLELQLMRSQMNPHFFFNALYSIQNFILQNKALESSRFLSKFSRLMRYTLESNEQTLISLDKELKSVRDYLELEQLRFEDRFAFRIQCDDDLAGRLKIPPMILQPPVENAVVHGFRNIEYKGELLISVEVEEARKKLVVTITDNGHGLENKVPVDKPSKKSMAMRLTQRRLELLSHAHEVECYMEVLDRSKMGDPQSGVIVHLHLPFIDD